MRGATIPFATEEGRVASFVPMLFFEGDRLFFRGTEGGSPWWSCDGSESLSHPGRKRAGSAVQRIVARRPSRCSPVAGGLGSWNQRNWSWLPP